MTTPDAATLHADDDDDDDDSGSIDCRDCQGTGVRWDGLDDCDTCGGTGQVERW